MALLCAEKKRLLEANARIMAENHRLTGGAAAGGVTVVPADDDPYHHHYHHRLHSQQPSHHGGAPAALSYADLRANAARSGDVAATAASAGGHRILSPPVEAPAAYHPGSPAALSAASSGAGSFADSRVLLKGAAGRAAATPPSPY